MKRPLFQVAILFATGILTARSIPLHPYWILAAALAIAVVGIAWSRFRAQLLFPLIFLAGWANFSRHTAVLSPDDLRNLLKDGSEIVTVRGRLCETPVLRVSDQEEEPRWRTMAQIDVTSLRPYHADWRRAYGRMAVSAPGTLTNFFAGQKMEITGVAQPPKSAIAEGTFDYRAYLRELGIYFQLRTASEQDWQAVSALAKPGLADRFRPWAQKALALGLPTEDEPLRLQWALTLGWKTALTPEVTEPFVRAATYHIFAVDGLRMAIIFGIFLGLFRAAGVPRAICGVILIPLIWFYAALTGWPASAIRATIMLTVVIVGWCLKRPSDLINSLYAAALIILAWQPQQLFQAGFQLSFFVVLCIILMVPRLHEYGARLVAPDPLLPKELHPQWRVTFRGPLKFLADLLLTSFAAWVGSLPLVALYFNILTPVSTPANILAVPLCALVLISNFASLLLAGWFPAAAILFNHAGWGLMKCILDTSVWFAKWPAAYYYVPAPELFTCALFYTIFLAVVTGWLFKARFRRLKIIALSIAALVWAGFAMQEIRTTRLTIVPVNGGTAIYFDARGRKGDLLINCGSAHSVQWVIKPFLRAQGVNRLAGLVLTHGQIRQAGGAPLIDESFQVQRVYLGPVPFHSQPCRQIVEGLEKKPRKVAVLTTTNHLGRWAVLHPGNGDRFAQADDNALVLAGSTHDIRILMLADLGRPGQNALLERTNDLRADIVISGIPIQTEALSDGLLDAIQPKLIIVSDSDLPPGARASTKLKERLAARKVPVIYTRSAGAATIRIRGYHCEVTTMAGERFAFEKQAH